MKARLNVELVSDAEFVDLIFVIVVDIELVDEVDAPIFTGSIVYFIPSVIELEDFLAAPYVRFSPGFIEIIWMVERFGVEVGVDGDEDVIESGVGDVLEERYGVFAVAVELVADDATWWGGWWVG